MVVWTCFVNMCTCIYCVLYCSYCVFVLFRLCIFILICCICTTVRTTATKWKLNCSSSSISSNVIIWQARTVSEDNSLVTLAKKAGSPANYPTIINSTEHNPSAEASSFSATKYPIFNETWRFTTMSTTSCHLSQSWASPMQGTPCKAVYMHHFFATLRISLFASTNNWRITFELCAETQVTCKVKNKM